MSALDIQLTLAGSRYGRILFHLCCLVVDRHYRWHISGIAREFPIRWPEAFWKI
jgi:hypothetical protein